MSVIVKENVPPRRTTQGRSTSRRSLRELTRGYFAHEKKWQFIVEAVLFAIIAVISAWPIVVAADALGKFLQSSGT
jgi:hypothetical protein